MRYLQYFITREIIGKYIKSMAQLSLKVAYLNSKNLYILKTYCIIEIFLVLYIVPKNQEKIVFYVNNDID